MLVRVLFFGQIKDVTGCREQLLELPSGAVLADVFEHFAQRFPKLEGFKQSTVLARNQQFTDSRTQLADGDEVAFLPPVSGGSSPYPQQITDERGNFFALTRSPIDNERVRREMLQGSDGAVVDFTGVVRNNTRGRETRFLDYECYEAMAVKMMAQIGGEIAASHDIGRIAMVHRLGRMEIGEASVMVLVCAPHRGPAFEAALEGINRLKKLVPIWKKEHFADGEVWVDGEWDDSVLQPR